MIVTRRRKARRHIERILIPLALAALIVAAFIWPPSRERLHAVPAIGAAMDRFAGAMDVGALQEGVHRRDRRIAGLRKEIAGLRSDIVSRDKQISALTTQTNRLSEQLAAAPQATPRPAHVPGAGTALPPASSDAAQIVRTAQVWNEMDPGVAAKIAQRLPGAYVVSVFAQMEPGQVAEILGEMPPKLAAHLTATRPAQVARRSK